MNLKDLKNKLKNKVQESKTKKFVEEHKRDFIKYGICAGVGLVGGFVISKYVQHVFDQKLLCELKMRSISYNTAAVNVSGEQNAAKIYETAKAIDQSMHTEFAGLRYKDVNTLLDNRGTKLPKVQ